MRKRFIKNALVAALVLGLFCVPAAALAHGRANASSASAGHGMGSSTASGRMQSSSAAAMHEPADGQATAAEHRLAGDHLQRCEARAAAMNNIMKRIVDRGTKQTDLFSTIAARAEAFYFKQGKTLSNYDDLVSSVDSAKTQATTDLQTLKDKEGFTCDSSNPKGEISGFRTALQTEITDLKKFRTAVKNLIVGIKSVQGAMSSDQGGAQ